MRRLLKAAILLAVTAAVLVGMGICVSAEEYDNLKYYTSNGTIIISGPTDQYVTSVTIPDQISGLNVTEIKSSAFKDCTQLSSVELGQSLKAIGSQAFYNCDSLYDITIPDSVTTIGDYAFYDCGMLTDVALGKNIQSIGSYSFQNCDSLYDITIPDSVTTIGSGAFAGCDLLTDVALGNSLKSIGSSVFTNCDSLNTITIPDSVTSIGDSAFYDCSLLSNVILGSSIRTIGSYAFYNCDSLNIITIPDSVTSIGSYAFQDCNLLRTVNLGKSIRTIGSHAFRDCGSLTAITIPDSVTSINDCAFYNCSLLKDVALGANLQTIGSHAFYNCIRITSITVPDKVVSIGDSAFNGCTALTDVSLGQNVQTIGSYAFSNCGRLKKITIPDKVTSLGSNSFNNCDMLTEVIFGANLQTIGSYAFYDCDGLQTIMITDNVTTIGDYAFEYCDKLESVVFGEYVSTVGSYAFAYCPKLNNVVFNDNLQTIGSYAFRECGSLQKVTIPDNVTKINSYAFYKCDTLKEVVFGEYVSQIGDCAFHSCPTLTGAYFKGDAPLSSYFGSNVFSGAASNFTIYYISGKTGWTTPTWNGYNTATWEGSSVDENKNFTHDLDLTKDIWSFRNSDSDFSKTLLNNGYYITSNDYNRLTSNLTSGDKMRISQSYKKGVFENYFYNVDNQLTLTGMYKEWGGSCYGMSSWVVLAWKGLTNFKKIPGYSNAANLYSIKRTDDSESAINFYHHQWQLRNVRKSASDFMSLEQKTQIELLVQRVKESPTVISFGWCNVKDGTCDEDDGHGHSIVGYGIEYGSYNKEIRGVTYSFDARIITYDCSVANNIEDYYIYLKTGPLVWSWAIPGRNIYSFTSYVTSISDNGCFTNVSNDPSILNAVDYLTGDTSFSNDSVDDTIITANALSRFEFSVPGKVYEVSGINVYQNGEISDLNCIITPNITLDNEYHPTDKTIVINGENNVQIKSEGDTFSVSYADYLLFSGSDSEFTADFTTDGSVSVDNKNDSGDSYITIVANDGFAPLMWNEYAVKTTNGDITAKLTDDGLVIESSDLSNVEVTVAKDDIEKKISFSTDETAVLIIEEDITSDIIPVIMIDTDNNGSYETELGRYEPSLLPDIDSDGTPGTPRDAMFLARWLAGWEGIEINLAAADLDGDEAVTVRDAVILARHIAGWEGYDVLPYKANP